MDGHGVRVGPAVVNAMVDAMVDAINVTYCAALVDQWVRDGLAAAFIAPGSRSTPLALAFAARDDITVELFHDERGASFGALGHGLATGKPAAVVCTSGTAAAHFLAAVIEADLSAVPMLVCTADRPPELWGRGAPQTIDQTELYGSAVREFVQPGPPDELDRRQWRPIARRAWVAATGPTPGPVHLNLSFSEPLTGRAGELPSALDPDSPRGVRHRVRHGVASGSYVSGVGVRRGVASGSYVSGAATVDVALTDRLVAAVSSQRGVIIAGRSETDPDHVLALAAALAWPVLADHRSGCRRDGHDSVVHRFDSLLRHRPFADPHQPDVVLRIGEILSSKAVSQWLSRIADSATVLASRPHGRHIDPENIADIAFDEVGVIEAVLRALPPTATTDSSWLASWRWADDLAEAATVAELGAEHETEGITIDETNIDETNIDEITVARKVVAAVPLAGALVVASSMPVRDVEWFGPARGDITVLSNRGANGIDGTIATAIGVALTGLPTICLVGDVAFLHDSSSLIALRERSIDLTIVVIDNDGGGIFSFLPQHDQLETERYEQLFGTPHGTDLAALVAAHGIAVEPWPADLAPRGVRAIIATTERQANRRLHDAVHAGVAQALGPAPVLPGTPA